MEKIIDLVKTNTVLFFDMDGTLFDTNLANFMSYKKAIHLVINTNVNLTYNQEKRFNRNSLKEIFPNLSKYEYNDIIEKKEQCFNEFLSETKPNQKIVEILFKYAETHKTILLTNARENRAKAILEYYGITNKFNNFFFNSNILKNKYQKAILELGILPNLVVAFEDEDIEIEKAKQIGIKTIINIKKWKNLQ